MGICGPKSVEALVTPTVADLRGDARPEPPADLTEEQAAEWRAVVERLPADWLPRETRGLVAKCVCYIATAQRLPDAQASLDGRPEGRLPFAPPTCASLNSRPLTFTAALAGLSGSPSGQVR